MRHKQRFSPFRFQNLWFRKFAIRINILCQRYIVYLQKSMSTTPIENPPKGNLLVDLNDIPSAKEPEKTPFWTENPNVIFDPKHIFEFFPVDTMTYEQKLNAVTRAVVILTIVGMLLSNSLRLFIVCCITLGAIFILYYYHTKEQDIKTAKKGIQSLKENFEGPARDYLTQNNIPIPNDIFSTPTSDNPFNNVLVTDYDYNPNKQPAPPAFNKNVNDKIVAQTKQFINDVHPDQPDISKKLFSSLGDNLDFEQSLRPFHSTASTTIPNDQGAFAEFCYGSMISCKEGNDFACARNLTHYTNY